MLRRELSSSEPAAALPDAPRPLRRLFTPPELVRPDAPVLKTLEAAPELMITHEPGQMFVTDLPRESASGLG